MAQIDQTTAPLIGALIAAAVALIVGLRSSSVAQASGAADRKIAKMRMDWLRDLRALLAQYVAALIHRKPEDHSKVEELRADLRLMLNLSTEENKGEKLHEALWKLAEKAKGSDDRATREALAEKIENVGRGVLKATWDQIKSEVHGGAKPGNIALIACGLYLVALIPLFLIGYVTDTIGHSRVHQTAVYPATWLLGVLGFEGYRRDEWDAFLLCVPLAG